MRPPPREAQGKGEMASDGRTTKALHDLGLVEALRTLRRQVWLVLGVAAAVATIAVVLSLLQDKEYTASATVYSRSSAQVVLVRAPKQYNSALIAPRFDAGREAVSSTRLASLDVVARRTAQRIGGGLSGEELSGMLDVRPILESDLIELQATASSPRLAAEYANAFAREYIEFRYEGDESKVRRATRLVTRQLRGIPESRLSARALRSRRQHLQILNIVAALQTGNLEFVGSAKPPSSPSSPKPARNGFFGLVLGLLLGLTLGLIRDRIGARSNQRTVPRRWVDRVASRESR
jgi:uncharacterized protein involved in exopolysaccharide biosynthesis